MVKRNIIISISLLFILTASAAAQENGQISRKRGELSQIKKEITSLESQIQKKTTKEKETYAVLDNYNKQSYLLNKLINRLKTEEEIKQREINKSTRSIKATEKEIAQLKRNYAKYVVAVYKFGPADEWASILDSKSFEQALLRYKYLQKFSESRQRDLKKLKDKTQQLIALKAKLESERKEKEELASQKEDEQAGLKVKQAEKKKILNAIRHDKASMKQELLAKKSAEKGIQDLITKLIEEEKKRKEAERLARLARERKKKQAQLASKSNTAIKNSGTEEDLNTYDLNLSTEHMASFSALKGKLNWPVSKGKIIRKFGENKNQQLNTVTLNYGVDVKTEPDAQVRAVAEGVVSVIDWLPGYGSVVIVTHKDDYRTVFSHLAEIYVREGDKVKLGTPIGKVGESLEGYVLHFEIWNSRNKQDPENWLFAK